MASPRLIQQNVLAWIERQVGDGVQPDETGLAVAFPLIDARAMRAVLADLCDAGKVSVDWKAEPATVALGRKAKPFVPVGRVDRSVVKPVKGVDEGVDRIRRILDRGKKPLAAAAVPKPKEIGHDAPISAIPGGVQVAEGIGQPSFSRGRKPFIRATVIRAAKSAGMPLDRFVTMLIDRGLDDYLASANVAAAA